MITMIVIWRYINKTEIKTGIQFKSRLLIMARCGDDTWKEGRRTNKQTINK